MENDCVVPDVLPVFHDVNSGCTAVALHLSVTCGRWNTSLTIQSVLDQLLASFNDFKVPDALEDTSFTKMNATLDDLSTLVKCKTVLEAFELMIKRLGIYDKFLSECIISHKCETCNFVNEHYHTMFVVKTNFDSYRCSLCKAFTRSYPNIKLIKTTGFIIVDKIIMSEMYNKELKAATADYTLIGRVFNVKDAWYGSVWYNSNTYYVSNEISVLSNGPLFGSNVNFAVYARNFVICSS